MKKIFISAAVALIALGASAANDYQYLSFVRNDGTTVQIDASGAEITYADGTVYVESSTGDFSFAFAELNKMFFTSEKTGVAAVEAAENGAVDVFTTAGVAVGTFGSIDEAKSQLTPGIYVVKSGDTTVKISF